MPKRVKSGAGENERTCASSLTLWSAAASASNGVGNSETQVYSTGPAMS